MYRSATESSLNDQDELFNEAERTASKDSFLLSTLTKSLASGLRDKDVIWAAVSNQVKHVQGLLDAADPQQQARDKERKTFGF